MVTCPLMAGGCVDADDRGWIVHHWLEHYWRSVTGAVLLVGSAIVGLFSQFDAGQISAGIGLLAGAGVGAYLLIQGAKIKADAQRADADREQRKKDVASKIEGDRLLKAHEIRMKRADQRANDHLAREHDRAMKGTLQKQVEELTAALEAAKGEAIKAKEVHQEDARRSSEERAYLMQQLEVARHEIAELRKSSEANGKKLDAIATQVKKRRILVVDDSEDACAVMSRFFSKENYEVACARSLKEAREAYKGTCYWAIIDVGLPDGSGIEMASYIKDMGFATKVAIVTGMDGDDVIAKADEERVDLIFRKPINLDLMLAEMHAMDDFAPRVKSETVPRKRKGKPT